MTDAKKGETFTVIGHDRGHVCLSCGDLSYCNDCGVCEHCGYVLPEHRKEEEPS